VPVVNPSTVGEVPVAVHPIRKSTRETVILKVRILSAYPEEVEVDTFDSRH
jgi:hypothetical protein